MRALSIVVIASVTLGCTVLNVPDRDALVGFDAEVDADAMEGGFDAGPDAGDAGCTPTEPDVEFSCSDGIDNDCNGHTDCADLACGASGYCCDAASGGAWGVGGNWTSYLVYGVPAQVTSGRVQFASGSPQQLVLDRCAPLAFGMHLQADFDIVGGGGTGDYASILLSTVTAPSGSGTILSEMRVRIDAQGIGHVERGGTQVGETMGTVGNDPFTVSLDLVPGVDSMQRPVLLGTVRIGGEVVLNSYEFIPLGDLRGSSAGCTPDGLFVALEGLGRSVEVVSGLSAQVGGCDNPSQFLADRTSGPLEAFDVAADPSPGPWRAGGVGEPTLAHFRSGADERLEILFDTSEIERSDEDLRPIDFAIGGVDHFSGTFRPRTDMSDPAILGPVPSSREPSITALLNPSGEIQGDFFLAFAREAGSNFEIWYADLDLVVTVAPGAYRVAALGDAPGCNSLRDPSIVALDESGNPDLLLFFTCEGSGAEERIATLRLRYSDGYQPVPGSLTFVLDRTIGTYAMRGVHSPEAVVTSREEGTVKLRLWFLAEDASGRARVAVAYGEVPTDGVPTMAAFPGNPILDPEDAVLGGACPSCTIDSLAVMRTLSGSAWTEPSYAFLIERSDGSGPTVDHQLIPLHQPRPDGE